MTMSVLENCQSYNIPPVKPASTSRVLTALDALSISATSSRPPCPTPPLYSSLFRSSSSPVVSFPPLSDAQGQPRITNATRLAKVPSESTLDTISAKAIQSIQDQAEIPTEDWYSYKDYGIKAPVYTKNEDEVNDLVQMLQPGPVGFDMEWRVVFRKNAQPLEYKTAVIQVCDDKLILVIQISAMGKVPSELKALIEDKSRIKLGVNILNDGRKLFRDYGVFAANLVELGSVALQADKNNPFNRHIVSLAKITKHYCKKPLFKGEERVSNWELDLSKNMLDYAANDAHCALMVYRNLLRIANNDKATLNIAACAGHIAPPPPPMKTVAPEAASSTSPSVTTNTTTPPAEDEQSAETSREIDEIIASSVPATAASTEQVPPPAPQQKVWVRPQHMRAYRFWRAGMNLDTMCKKVSMAGEAAPIKPATVIGYIVSALQTDVKLEFNLDALVQLVQQDPTEWSWRVHRDWIAAARTIGRGVVC